MMSRLSLLTCVRRLATERRGGFNVLNLRERGLIEVLLPEESENYFLGAHNRPRTFYCGFDPTASSLHLGNLSALMLLFQVQRRGHSVIALVGGATAMIGDPSGRTKERDAMEDDELINNSTHVTNTLMRLFDNHEKILKHHKFYQGTLGSWEVIDNASWSAGMSAVDLAVDVGGHLRLRDLLSKESVKQRMASEQGMSIKEFIYPMFQAHDWLRLFQQRDCGTQIGGNDQQGNIDIGQKLIYKVTGKRAFGLTVPLLTRKDGSKIGKSDSPNTQTLWLSPEMTSSFAFYQHLLQTRDDDVERFLRIFTFLPLSDIRMLMERHLTKPELRLAQTTLAKEVTLLVHGEEGLKSAQVATRVAFPQNDPQDSKRAILEMTMEMAIAMDIPILRVPLEPNVTILALVMKTALYSSELKAIDLIKQGAVSINHETITNPLELIRYNTHITENNLSLLRIGKRRFFMVHWTE